MGGKTIENVKDSVKSSGVVTREYIDTQLNLKLPKAGGKVLGEL